MKKEYLLPAILLVFFYACTKEEKDPEPPAVGATTNLFPGTELIGIPPYYYTVNTDSDAMGFEERGDSSFQPRLSAFGFALPREDNMSSKPFLSWVPTGLRFVMVGIFDSIPEVSQINGFHISNPSSLIWAWNTELGTGREGAIHYSGGLRFKDGGFVGGVPAPLTVRSRLYYWAIWAWDENADQIIYSSRVIPFRVTVEE